MLLCSHLSNNYSLAINVLEIISNEVFYFLFSYTLLPVCSPKDVGTAEKKTHKPTYKLMCMYSGQLIKLFQGTVCNHN